MSKPFKHRAAYTRGPSFARTIPVDCALVVLGAAAILAHPSAQWVEAHFSNGYYPVWERFWSSFTPSIPFALGDLVIALGILAILTIPFFVRPWWRALLGIGGLAGFFAIWFYAGWGFGSDRAPVTARTAFDAARVNPQSIDALRRRVIAQVNRLAPIAHAREPQAFDEGALHDAWLPVVQRLGDRWTPHVAPAKPPAAGWFMDKTGTSGFTNPFTLETQLAPDLLWFERPFSQAHEWSHVAGYNREDEANYIAVLACLRDPDPVAQYSGWIELFMYLPPLKAYPHSMFVPQVWADFAAIRKRNQNFVNVDLSRFSWHVYNRYLKSNHIAAGVVSYDQVTRLVAGTPLDKHGLPVPER